MKVIGEKFERNRYEIQQQDNDGRWFVQSRSSTTLEEARERLAEKTKSDRLLRRFLDCGQPGETRIVRVTAICEVVE